jgi:hypothetical protein
MFRKPEVKDPIFAESIDELLKLTPQHISQLIGVTFELQ